MNPYHSYSFVIQERGCPESIGDDNEEKPRTWEQMEPIILTAS